MSQICYIEIGDSMERVKKVEMMKNKIVESAFSEFNLRGYDKTSMDSICQRGSISKGIIYHYFKSKKDLYLHCVKHCFDTLIAYIESEKLPFHGEIGAFYDDYFDLRIKFFKEHPDMRKMFYDNLIAPTKDLYEDVSILREELDQLHINMFADVFDKYPLRKGIKVNDAMLHIKDHQAGVYLRYSMLEQNEENIITFEESAKHAIILMLEGLLQ